MLELAFGLAFTDLYRREGLLRLDAAFLDLLGAADGALKEKLLAGRADPAALDARSESALILRSRRCAPWVCAALELRPT